MEFRCSQSRLANKERDASSTLEYPHLFREDVVQLESQPGLLGIVDSLSGDPLSSDSEGDSPIRTRVDDDREQHAYASQQAAVLWLNGDEAASVDVSQLRVVDRWFTHGQVVAWESASTEQLGKVTDVSVTVGVELVDGSIRRGLDSKKLQRLRSLAAEDFVVQGPWVGEVKTVGNNVTVVFESDGATCKVVDADPDYLKAAGPGVVHDDNEYPYYPGQKVIATASHVFKTATWLQGRYKSGRLNATVVAVENGTVRVRWLVARDGRATAPPCRQNPQDLLPLTHFSYAEWQLGDRCHAVFPTEEKLSDNNADQPLRARVSQASASHHNATVTVKKAPPNLRESTEFIASAARIINMKTKVDVLWQDSSRSLGVDSRDLRHIRTVVHDFFPTKCVQIRNPAGGELLKLRTGIVQRVDPQRYTAVVRWISTSAEHPEEDTTEVMNFSDLVPHPQFCYDVADAVVRLPKSKSKASAIDFGKGDHQWVGTITGLLLDGGIQVKWLDGSLSTVKPGELCVVLHQNSSSSSSTSNSSNDSLEVFARHSSG